MLKFGVVVVLLAAIAVPTALFATQTTRTTGEARIQAVKHEDGRIEFALQVREGSGWSERILPSGRFFPANARVGNWLSSTAVETVPYVPIEGGIEWWEYIEPLTEPGAVWHSANRNFDHQSGRFETRVKVLADRVEGPGSPRVEFEASCLERNDWSASGHAERYASFSVVADGSFVTVASVDLPDWNAPFGPSPDYMSHPENTTYILIRGTESDGTVRDWWVNQIHSLDWLLGELMEMDSLAIAVGGYREHSNEFEWFSGAFPNWSELWQTSVQPNFEFCGLY